MKKFLALFMTFIMVFCFSVSAVAAEPEKVNGELSLVSEETVVSESVSEQAEPRASVGDPIAFGATTITGGSGTLSVYLSSGNFWSDIVAGIGYASQNGSVTCSVVTPDGTSISLGTEVNISGESYLRFGPFVFETVDVEVEVTVAEPSKKYIKTGEEVNYQITLSETATVDKNKITLTGDGVTGSTIEVTGSGTSYVATVTGGTGNGAVTLNVEAGAFTNSVGNQNRLTTKTGLTLDNIAPQVTIGEPSHQYIGAGETATYEITTKETVTLDNEKVSLSGAGSTGSSVEVTGSGTSFIATVTAGSESGEIILNIEQGAFTDLAGNLNTETSKAGLTIDNIAPTVTIGNPSRASIREGQTATYEITVSKEVTLDSSKITLTGTTGSTVQVTGSGRNYTVTVTGGTGNGAVTLNIATGAFKDIVGNVNGTSTKAGLTIDNMAPTVTIGSPNKASIKEGQTATFKITTNEITTIDSSKITLTGTTGSTINVTGSGTTYTVTVTGGTGNGAVTLSVAAGAFTDSAGNTSVATSKTGLTVDNTAPTVTIGSPSKTRIKSGGTATYEITVSETATLDKTKITVSGTSTVEITGSGTSYIVTVTGGTGNSLITLNVEAGAFTDTAGNANSAASKTGLILDNLSPQITIGDASTAYIGERRNSNI